MLKVKPILTEMADSMLVRVFESRSKLGEAAGLEAAAAIRALLASKAAVRIIFAAAPSQNEFLAALAAAKDLDWSRITAFHMDEYIGLPEGAPQSFGTFLREALFDKVKPGMVHYIHPAGGIEAECERYGRLLAEAPIDIVCLGIGENGHLAFNDPPVADFHDPLPVKAVTLDSDCRNQQVNDGCFASLSEVPQQALTLTIPVLLSAKWLFCMVPGKTKRIAVTRTLHEPVSTACPSTILRSHADCRLFVDTDSFGAVVG
jgi:glucosamine-6-phosphate deaminase